MEKLGTWADNPCWYASVVDGPKHGILLGPFRTEKDCREWAYSQAEDGGDMHKHSLLVKRAEECDDRAWFYSYGMVKMQNGYRYGVLNRFFREGAGTFELDSEQNFKREVTK